MITCVRKRSPLVANTAPLCSSPFSLSLPQIFSLSAATGSNCSFQLCRSTDRFLLHCKQLLLRAVQLLVAHRLRNKLKQS